MFAHRSSSTTPPLHYHDVIGRDPSWPTRRGVRPLPMRADWNDLDLGRQFDGDPHPRSGRGRSRAARLERRLDRAIMRSALLTIVLTGTVVAASLPGLLA